MNATMKCAAPLWLLIGVVTGCSSSAMIGPPSSVHEEIHSGSIEYVITRDGEKYEFETPPSISNDLIVGRVNGKQMSIAVSNVVWAKTDRIDWGKTVFFAVAMGATVAFVVYITPPLRWWQ